MRGVRTILPQPGTPQGAAVKGSASHLLPGHIICLLFSLFHSHIPLLITTTRAIQKNEDAQKPSHLRARLNTSSFRIQSLLKGVNRIQITAFN